MGVCVCVCGCGCACVRACLRTCVSGWMGGWVGGWVWVCVWVWVCACVHCVCVVAHAHAYMCPSVHPCTCMPVFKSYYVTLFVVLVENVLIKIIFFLEWRGFEVDWSPKTETECELYIRTCTIRVYSRILSLGGKVLWHTGYFLYHAHFW